jgi:two-component SAPR family response regulator
VLSGLHEPAKALVEMQILNQILFLDIEMPEMSGLQLAEKIIEAGNNIEIVFVTAYDKYALEAFRVNAIDYILKPFSSDDIAQAITRLKKVKSLPIISQMPADKGRIYCFGRLSVYGAGCREAVKWRTSKTEELFAFMLQNLNSEVVKWKITQAIWPECESEKQLNTNLHTTVYKVKKTLLSANIKFDFSFINGRYKMELPDVYIDTAEFEAITNTKLHYQQHLLKDTKSAGLIQREYLEENGYFLVSK